MAANHRKIVFHVGGPSFHPVADQAKLVEQWLGNTFDCQFFDGVEAFEALDQCDLLVVMGLHWTGMSATGLQYRPMDQGHHVEFEEYVRSGRPVLAHHGAIASYDDWPRFGELLGFTWVWGETGHSSIGDYHVHVLSSHHPIIAGVESFDIKDELYYDVKVTSDLIPEVHAEAEWRGQGLPMVLTASGGRVEGAGRTAYLANGHDLAAFACPAMPLLWLNTVNWLLERPI